MRLTSAACDTAGSLARRDRETMEKSKELQFKKKKTKAVCQQHSFRLTPTYCVGSEEEEEDVMGV